MLKGYKTYIVATLGLVWAIVGLTMGWLDTSTASLVVLNSLGLAGLRDAVK